MTRHAERPGRQAGVRIEAFDGLRGVGMTLVLLGHVARKLPAAPMRDPLLRVTSFSFTIMELFFVLSGFLITGLLYDAKGQPHYIRNYFLRRSLRVLPLYYFTLVILFWVIPLLPIPLSEQYEQLQSVQGWYWTHTTNIVNALGSEKAKAFYTGHFWSLAVEEQFYFIWPLLLWFLDRRGVLRLCAACIVLAVAFRAVLLFSGGRGAYMLTPGRMDSIAIGGALAIFARDPAGMRALAKHCRVPGYVAVAVFAAIVAHDRQVEWHGFWGTLIGYTAISVVWGTLLIWLAAEPDSRTARGLRNPFWMRLGQHSYAMYIVHLPLIWLILHLLPAEPFIVATGGTVLPAFCAYGLGVWLAAYLAALATWHLFEKRMLDLKRFFPAPPAVRAME